MRTLICGFGEIGKALHRVLKNNYEVFIQDPDEGLTFDIDIYEDGHLGIDARPQILHICFPYSDKFINEVRKYQEKYQPLYTVIHSTVKPGTSRELGAIHSAVIGLHPVLEESLKTFTKALAGEGASEVADYFRKAGIKVYLFDKQETSEVMKVLDTTFYGVCAEYTKEVKQVCDKYAVPFEAWTWWTNNYNHGYQKLGYPEYTRPNLIPIMKKLGGHCVLPNTQLLDTKFTNFLSNLNG